MSIDVRRLCGSAVGNANWASVLEELDAMGGVMRDGFMSPAR